MHAQDDFDPIVTRAAARTILGGISRDAMHEWEKSGRLPPPIYLSPRVVGWRRSTLEKFIAERAAGSGAGA